MLQTQRMAVARTAGLAVPKLLVRQVVPLALTFVLIWQFRHYLDRLDPAQIFKTLTQFELRQWTTAMGASAFSFWAIGRYDAVIHGVLGTDVTRQTAKRSGIAAIAIAQFTGFGLITGALVRWRLIPGFTLWRALRVSLTVSLSFLAAWGAITVLFAAYVHPDNTTLRLALIAIFAAGVGLIGLSLWQPGGGLRICSIRAMATILLLVMIDTFFAAAAFWAFLPAEMAVPAVTLFTAFLISLGAGMVGGTPGGLGPFEICLLAQLPMLGPDPMLAAALAFRMVYHVLPALLAGAYLIHRFMHKKIIAQPRLRLADPENGLPDMAERAVWNAPRAEANLFRHGALHMMCERGRPTCLAAPAGQTLVLLSDAFDPKEMAMRLPRLARALAATHQQSPLHYKCSARQALAYRRSGWQVSRIAIEAWLNPQAFDVAGSAHRQLRRMLRKAKAAEVTIKPGARILPITEMSRLSADWSESHGGERGFSMGWFDPSYIANQRVFLAYKGQTLIAFLTLNEVQDEWTLDLMRQGKDSPAGTMHALMKAAIFAARDAGCPRVSLASVPIEMTGLGALQGRFNAWFRKESGADGLYRFKSCFAPKWEPLYAAAPTKFRLAVGLWDVLRQVNQRRTPKNSGHS